MLSGGFKRRCVLWNSVGGERDGERKDGEDERGVEEMERERD